MASIIDGVYEIIDKELGVSDIGKRSPHHKNKDACIRTCNRSPLNFDCKKMLENIQKQMEDNYADSKRSNSGELWRFEKKEYYDKAKPGLETKLEKEIIRAVDNLWANQVPTSSGLLGGKSDGKRNIDLVHRNSTGNNEFTFYELKVNANYPLYAAMEIVIYGVLYCFARHLQKHDEVNFPKGADLLHAKKIHLRVVAPKVYYVDCSAQGLKNISDQINIGLTTWLENNTSLDVTMDFGFEHFYEGFSGREESGIDYASLMHKLQSATP